jgi:hypothetical protein
MTSMMMIALWFLTLTVLDQPASDGFRRESDMVFIGQGLGEVRVAIGWFGVAAGIQLNDLPA